MKPFALALLLLTAAYTPSFAQPATDASEEVVLSDTQEAFDKLKTLAGSWVGTITTTPVEPSVSGMFVQVSMRVTSRGNALAHELSITGLPDHPLTMFYLEEDRMLATHYCDAGNRPRMAGKVSPDGKTVEFEFLDLSGGDQYGHMHHVVFTFIDENHHTEEWTYMMPGDKPMRGRLDLQRINVEAEPSGT